MRATGDVTDTKWNETLRFDKGESAISRHVTAGSDNGNVYLSLSGSPEGQAEG